MQWLKERKIDQNVLYCMPIMYVSSSPIGEWFIPENINPSMYVGMFPVVLKTQQTLWKYIFSLILGIWNPIFAHAFHNGWRLQFMVPMRVNSGFDKNSSSTTPSCILPPKWPKNLYPDKYLTIDSSFTVKNTTPQHFDNHVLWVGFCCMGCFPRRPPAAGGDKSY